MGTYMIAKVKEKNKRGIIAANGPARLDVSLDNFYQHFTIELSQGEKRTGYTVLEALYTSRSLQSIFHTWAFRKL